MARFCPACGTQLGDAMMFCASCGTRTDTSVTSTQTAQPAQPQLQQQPTQPQQQYVPQPQPAQPQPTQPQPQYVQQPQPAQQQPQLQQQQPQYVQKPQQQYQPQYAPAPVPVKKKRKTPFIIAGAAVLVIALVVMLIVTNGFDIFGDTPAPPDTVQNSPPPETADPTSTPAPPEPTVDFIVGTWMLDTIEATDYTMGWEEYMEQMFVAGYTELIVEITFTDDGKATTNYLGETDNCTWSGNGNKYILTSSTGELANLEIIDKKLILYFEDEDNTTMAFIKKTSEDEPTSVSNGGYHDAPQGSAKFLEGKVLMVTVFVDVEGYEWSWEDFEAIRDKYDLAKEYLEAEAKRYGKDLELVWDFEADPDLVYKANISEERIALLDHVAEGSFEDTVSYEHFHDTLKLLDEYVENQIPYLDLAEKYGTDSITYCFQVKRRAPACVAFPYYPDLRPHYSYHEKFVMTDMAWWTAEALPHEILHTFGAIDQYRSNPAHGVSDALVEHARVNHPRDIMGFMTTGREHDRIEFEIGPITAYCLGWLDDIPEISMFPELKRYIPAAFFDQRRQVDPDSVDTGNTIPPSGGRIPITGITEFEFTPGHSDIWIFTSTDCGSSKVWLEIFDSQKKSIGRSRMGGGSTEEGGSNAFYSIWINEGETFYIMASFVDAAEGDNAKGSYTLIVENPETLPDSGGVGYLVNSARRQYYFTPNESGIWEIRHSDSDGGDIYYQIFAASDENPRGVYTNCIGLARPEDKNEKSYISVRLDAGVKYLLVLASTDNFSNYTVTVSKK